MMRGVLVFLLFFSASAFADFYQWSSSSYPSVKFDTPDLACAYVVSNWTNPSPYSTKTGEHQASFNTVINFDCKAQTVSKSNGSISYSSVGGINRSGSTCPNLDDTYNPQTGECEQPNVCSDTEGTTVLHMYHRASRANAYDPWPASGQSERPITICSNECRYSASGYSGEDTCGAGRNDPLNQFCITPYLGQGTECVEGDSDHQSQTTSPTAPGAEPNPNPVDPSDPVDPDDPTDPAVTCNMTPGYVWSGSVCTPIFDDEAPEPNPNQPAPGTPGGSNGSGEGSGGSTGGGDGSGTGDGDGSGDGSGDGTGSVGGGSQSDNPNNVRGTECKQTLQCTGDAYECALLYQQKESRCQIEEALDFEEQKPSIESLFDAEDYTMGEGDEIDIPSIIGQGSRFLPSSCPAPISIALSGKSYYLDTQPFCTFATDLSFLIVAFSTLAAALYIGRAFGGE